MDIAEVVNKNEPYLELLSSSEVPNKLKSFIVLLGPIRLTHCLCSCLLNAAAETFPLENKLKKIIKKNKHGIKHLLSKRSSKSLKKHRDFLARQPELVANLVTHLEKQL